MNYRSERVRQPHRKPVADDVSAERTRRDRRAALRTSPLNSRTDSDGTLTVRLRGGNAAPYLSRCDNRHNRTAGQVPRQIGGFTSVVVSGISYWRVLTKSRWNLNAVVIERTLGGQPWCGGRCARSQSSDDSSPLSLGRSKVCSSPIFSARTLPKIREMRAASAGVRFAGRGRSFSSIYLLR